MSEYDPTDTAGDTRAKYRFFSTVRRGYRPSKSFDGVQAASADGKPTMETSGDVTVDVDVRASEGPGETATASKSLDMYGPEHVTGIDASQVVRTEPSPGTGNFVPNYFPLVEFDTPDLPWLFSPVDHDDDSRTFPWFTLAVVEQSDEASVSVDTSSPNPVLEAPATELPPVEECWAWAHAQVVGSPHEKRAEDGGSTQGDPLKAEFESESNITVSRLIGARNLDPSTDYVAAVVPTVEAGRLVGLGEEPPAESSSNGDATEAVELAWQTGADSTVRLPVYYHWEFSTAQEGDFEHLVRKLESRRLSKPEYDIGGREVDVTDPGPEPLDFDDGQRHTVTVGGALQASPPGDWWYERGHELRTLLNQPASIEAESDWEVVGPPIYGKWHANVDSLFDLSVETDAYGGYGADKPALKAPANGGVYDEADQQWVHDLNLTPSFRLAAAVGTDVVQGQQETLMSEAWDQVGEVREANRLLGAAQLTRAALATTAERLSVPGYPDDRFLQYTAPAHDRLYLDGDGRTAGQHIEQSRAPSALFSPAYRRLTSSAGRLANRLADADPLNDLVSGVLAGEVSTEQSSGPDGMQRVDIGRRGPEAACEDFGQFAPAPEERERPGERSDAERADEYDAAGDSDRQPIVTNAIVQLLSMLETCDRIDDDLDGILRLLEGGSLDAADRRRVERLEGQATSKWDGLGSRVWNFHRVISNIARSESLPTVSDEFDTQKRIELYGDQSGQETTLGDMTRPFSETFITESRFGSFWDGFGQTRFPKLEGYTPPRERNLQSESPIPDRYITGDSGTDAGLPGDESERAAAREDRIEYTVPDILRAKGLVDDVERAIERVLSYFGVSEGDDGIYLERLFCGDVYERPERWDPQPGRIETQYAPVASFVDRVIERLGDERLAKRPDPLDTVMAYPEFTTPMFRDLKDESESYVLPGVDNVPKETVGALVTNPAFIEAYMAGLNHEMASELLWRRYPTDRRGSYFKRFWDQQSRIPKPASPEKMDDVLPLHRWEDKGPDGAAPSPLGSNTRTGEAESDPPKTESNPSAVSTQVVLLVRGELLDRYPNTDIYAAKAEMESGDRVPKWASSATKQTEADTPNQKFPVFRGKLDPDITFFGFDLEPGEARGDAEGEHGWFFVLAEAPTETRFGLDIGQDDETSPPFGVSEGSGSPVHRASEDQVDAGVEHGWSGLSWKHFGEAASPYLSVETTVAGQNDWQTVVGEPWAEDEAWTTQPDEDEDEEEESKFTFGEEEAAVWKRNSAHMAYITWQKPVRVAIHADDVLARARSRNGGTN